MPYFLYRQSPDRKTLTQIEVYDKFRDAKMQARELRKQQQVGDTDSIRVIFAKDKREAELLLKEANKPSSPLEEWEG